MKYYITTLATLISVNLFAQNSFNAGTISVRTAGNSFTPPAYYPNNITLQSNLVVNGIIYGNGSGLSNVVASITNSTSFTNLNGSSMTNVSIYNSFVTNSTIAGSIVSNSLVTGTFIGSGTISNSIYANNAVLASNIISGAANGTIQGQMLITNSALNNSTLGNDTYDILSGNTLNANTANISNAVVGIITNNSNFGVDSFGNLYAGALSGDGSGLGDLNASQLAHGTVPDARLSGNVASVTYVNQAVSVTNSPYAYNFLSSSSIKDQSVQSDVIHFYNELSTSGTLTNVSEWLSFQGRLGTNNTLVGNPANIINFVQNNYGMVMTGVTTGLVTLPSVLSNYTVIAQYKILPSDITIWANRGGGCPIWLLNNTNTGSTYGLFVESGAGLDRHFYGTYQGGTFTNQYTYSVDIQTFFKPISVGYSVVVAVSVSNGTNSIWQDTRPGYFSASTISSPVLSASNTLSLFPDSFNQLQFGMPLTNSAADSQHKKVPYFQLASLVVLSTNASQAMINSVYRAMSWLDLNDDLTFFAGDSRMQEYAIYTNSTVYENSWPGVAYQNNPDHRYINLSRGGTTTTHLVTNVFTKTSWNWQELTNLSFGTKIKKITAVTGLGFNDNYLTALSPSASISNYNAVLPAAKLANINLTFAGVFDAATNNITYSYQASYWTNFQIINEWALTNSLFSGYIPFDRYFTQSQMNPVTGGLSWDGIHLGYLSASFTGSYIQAALFLKGIYDSNPKFQTLVTAIIGNGAGITNLPPPIVTSNPTNQYVVSTLYTNVSKGRLIGSFVLNPTVGAASSIVINYTNNGVGYFLPVYVPSGAIAKYMIPFGIDFSTNSTFIASTNTTDVGLAYITNTVYSATP